MNMFLKQEISCQWTVDLIMEATIIHPVEVRRNRICCCDTPVCSENTYSLPNCSTEVYECDVLVLIKLSDCSKCPSLCCLTYFFGVKKYVQITDASFQVDGEPASVVKSKTWIK